MKDLAAVVMAGGIGSRMNSPKPKVLHEIGGKPMLYHTLSNLVQTGIEDIYVVVGYKAEEVIEAVKPHFKVVFARQPEMLGTGDAVKQALSKMDSCQNVLVMGGDDSAFYTSSTILEFIHSHRDSRSVVSIMTLIDPSRQRMGKIFRDEKGEFKQILEFSEYSQLNLSSDEIGCGIYIFEFDWLKENIAKVEKNPVKGEYYLTELLNIAKQQDNKINIHLLQHPDEWFGINTEEELASANRLWQAKKHD